MWKFLDNGFSHMEDELLKNFLWKLVLGRTCLGGFPTTECHLNFHTKLRYIIKGGKEAAIHWNCPPDGLGRRALDKLFGHNKWNFIAHYNQPNFVVTKRLKRVESKLAFF